MAPVRLHADILEVISEFLTEVSDVLSFARTSLVIHKIGIRRLLSMRPISLVRDFESVQKFHSFLFFDAPARTPYVRALEIERGPTRSDGDTEHLDDTPLLLEILTTCLNIRSVSIYLVNNDPTGLACDLQLAHAIAALPHLRSLTLFSSTESREVLLGELRASLHALSLWGYTEETRIYHPAALETFLPRIASNLENFQLGDFVVDPEELQAWGVSPTPVCTITQYAMVRSLSMHLYGAPLLEHLQHLFPALDGTLSFIEFQRSNDDIMGNPADIRSANERPQEASSSRPWKELDCILCEPQTWYLLGLRCPAKQVVLRAMDVPLEPYAVDALRENPVPRLKLVLRHQSSFVSLCTPELARTLMHITLVLVYPFQTLWEPENPMDTPEPPLWQDVMDVVVSSLQPLQELTYLRLAMRADPSRCAVNWNDDIVKPIVARAKAYVRSFHESMFDFDGTAAALARSLRSLKYIFIETDGSLASRDRETHHWYDLEWWHAVRGWRVADELEPGSRLVGLHYNVAETITRKEDLRAGEADSEDEDF